MREIDGMLGELQRDIVRQRQLIEDRQTLVVVLEHDGHDASDHEAVLREDRARLAVMVARQFALVSEAL